MFIQHQCFCLSFYVHDNTDTREVIMKKKNSCKQLLTTNSTRTRSGNRLQVTKKGIDVLEVNWNIGLKLSVYKVKAGHKQARATTFKCTCIHVSHTKSQSITTHTYTHSLQCQSPSAAFSSVVNHLILILKII